jgi:hypothetical protein
MEVSEVKVLYYPRWCGEWIGPMLEEPLLDAPFELEGLSIEEKLDVIGEALRQGAWPGVPCLIEVVDEERRPVARRAVWR